VSGGFIHANSVGWVPKVTCDTVLAENPDSTVKERAGGARVPAEGLWQQDRV